MSLLHPYFIIAIIYILIFSFQEVYGEKVDKKWLWFLGGYLIILAGLRNESGPDYGSYLGIYSYSDTKYYQSIFMKALFLDSPQPMELEWLFVLINKVLLNVFNAPFYMLTLVIATITIILKIEYIDDNTFYPFTFILFVFVPGFFVGESGQIRQCLGSFIVYYGFRFIKERRLWMYLLCVYLGAGIHNVCFIFLPMYWLARVPLNKFWMLILILGSIFASPFEVYRIFGSFLDSIAGDVMVVEGFNGYMDESTQRLNGGFGLPEGMMLILTFFLFYFDTPMREKYPYYEYHRNYAVLGICCYFIFRNNPIFSSRLAGAFIGFGYLIIPNAMYVVSYTTKRLIHTFIILLFAFLFIVYSSFGNMEKGNFTKDRYKNFLLP